MHACHVRLSRVVPGFVVQFGLSSDPSENRRWAMRTLPDEPALQDNRRATLVGPSKTFGKGRIQNVQRLVGGSGVSVTKAKYVTPAGNDIHGVGLTPDVLVPACAPTETAATCVAGIRVR